MIVATWNVNSIRARLERLLAWLERARPDVVCLQELKVANEAFPMEAIRAAGYHSAFHGQKTYNGVAILSRGEPSDVKIGLADDVEDAQARLISASIAGVRVLSVYVPNGGTVGSEAWTYKLKWLSRLREHLARHFNPADAVLLCGDLNVAVDDADAARPEEWGDTVLCHAEARSALAAVMEWGLADAFRNHNPQGGIYSWWDYRQLGFPRNNGLRLDHILATAPLAARSTAAWVDRDERKGVKPSDHAPVLAEFDG